MYIAEESEARPVLGPAGNKARSPSITCKPASKPLRKVERAETGKKEEKKKESSPVLNLPPLVSSLSAPSSALRRQELLLYSNLSLNASCSSDASTDSFCSRASTGRIGRSSFTNGRRQGVPRTEKIAAKILEKIVPDGEVKAPPEFLQGKRRCAWVTPNTGEFPLLSLVSGPMHINYHLLHESTDSSEFSDGSLQKVIASILIVLTFNI